jgi:hypothetical protein
MRDRAVAPVEHSAAAVPLVEVGHVQVVVLDGRREPVGGELGAEGLELRRERA